MYLCHTKEEKCKVFLWQGRGSRWGTLKIFRACDITRMKKFESLTLQASGG